MFNTKYQYSRICIPSGWQKQYWKNSREWTSARCYSHSKSPGDMFTVNSEAMEASRRLWELLQDCRNLNSTWIQHTFLVEIGGVHKEIKYFFTLPQINMTLPGPCLARITWLQINCMICTFQQSIKTVNYKWSLRNSNNLLTGMLLYSKISFCLEILILGF